MSNTIFRPSDLEQLLQKTIVEQLPERVFSNGSIVQTTPVALGARIVTQPKANIYGRAAFVTWGNTQDIPSVDVFIEEVSIPVHPLKIKYGVTEDEILSADFAGIDVKSPRVEAAVQALFDRIDDVGYVGNTALGLYGIANQPNSTVITLPAVGTGSTTTFATKTAQQIADDLFAIATEAGRLSRNAYKTPIILLPVQQYYTCIRKRSTGTGEKTALALYFESIMALYGERAKVYPCPYLDTAGAGGVPVAIALSDNPSHGGYVRVPSVRNSPVETYQGNMEGRMSAYLGGIMFSHQIAVSRAIGI
jgi:hypothetical protein